MLPGTPPLRQAVDDGATELDMVLNIGWLRSGLVEQVQVDIAAVTTAVAGRAIVKVILENALLSDAEKVAGCRAVEAAGAHFVSGLARALLQRHVACASLARPGLSARPMPAFRARRSKPPRASRRGAAQLQTCGSCARQSARRSQ